MEWASRAASSWNSEWHCSTCEKRVEIPYTTHSLHTSYIKARPLLSELLTHQLEAWTVGVVFPRFAWVVLGVGESRLIIPAPRIPSHCQGPAMGTVRSLPAPVPPLQAHIQKGQRTRGPAWAPGLRWLLILPPALQQELKSLSKYNQKWSKACKKRWNKIIQKRT